MEDVKIFIPNLSPGVIECIVRERKEKEKGTNKKETIEKLTKMFINRALLHIILIFIINFKMRFTILCYYL